MHVLSFHLRCITPLKLKILKILNFSTIILFEISRPLATKLRDPKMFNMAFQVVFSAKNVPRFSFGLLVAPKLKKRGGAIMPPPRAITSFQRPGQIWLTEALYLSQLCCGSYLRHDLFCKAAHMPKNTENFITKI